MSEKLESVREVVKRRDCLTDAGFDDLLAAFTEELQELAEEGRMFEVEDLIAEYFGLGPDYLFDRELNVFG